MKITIPLVNGRRAVIALPFAWLALCFLLPFLIVLRLSMTELDPEGAGASLFSFAEGVLTLKLKVANYLFLLQDELYVLTYLSSLKVAAITTALCLLIGYPFAYFMARARPAIRPTLLML
ncbi:MAG: putrescine ABC transporter permease PotH, partial [Massilia sp.]